MPSDIAIRVENLGKRYVIGRETRRAATLAGRVRQTLASPFSWLSSQLRGPSEEEILWALQDVSFEVKRGEVLGVIGRNGAGKSTLLKILSRITEPTTGNAEMHGRIGALLEVGTGMHPELTGRENIYLNGTIIGMREAEIAGKFDEIVDFSGIERFLDTPVKRYSSGMRVRLGFAIAAHLEPEILIVDEVLAVGDAEFQQKCLGKMKDVAGHGRTVLFVSHNMGAINSLCSKCILVEAGHLRASGSPAEIVAQYIRADTNAVGFRKWEDDESAPGSDDVRLLSVACMNEEGVPSSTFGQMESISIVVGIEVLRDQEEVAVAIQLVDSVGTIIGHLSNDLGNCSMSFAEGVHRITCRIL
ncbi:MAG: ABC transporter ATP-binding protein, partial [Victivallales bacterium]|nr:ABC transporter ATP-binding protein [Victivallales bacterium]